MINLLLLFGLLGHAVTTRFRILQIGDIHYPEAKRQERTVDAKDTAFPEILTTRLGSTAFQSVFRLIQNRIQNVKYDAIVLMGDLTSRGCKQDYLGFLEYFEQLILSIPGVGKNCFILPGNHDVNREDAMSNDLSHKFVYMNEMLRAKALPEIELDEWPGARFERDGASISVYCANTCVGCGTLRSLPETFRNGFRQHIDRTVAKYERSEPHREQVFDELYEILDTPAITEKYVSWLTDKISNEKLTIVCGHHNLLPQKIPRISQYAEMINSGFFRDSMLSTGKFVIYLHGHIHDDPINFIQSPEYPDSCIVTISAPEVSDGFNELEIHFSENGEPLGCEVIPHRMNGGVPSAKPKIELPLCAARSLRSKEEQKIYEILFRERTLYWHELVEALERTRIFLDSAALSSVLISMKWRKQLRLKQESENPKSWMIHRYI